jgi:hypothetical protein
VLEERRNVEAVVTVRISVCSVSYIIGNSLNPLKTLIILLETCHVIA